MKNEKILLSIGLLINLIISAENEFITKAGSQFNNPWVKNVAQKFSAMPDHGIELGALIDGTIAWPRYTDDSDNKRKVLDIIGIDIKVGGGDNHLQSIVRGPYHLKLGDYFFISGSDPWAAEAHLFVIKLNSEKGKKKLSSNLPITPKAINGKVVVDDKIIEKIVVSKKKWHIGGMDICGKYLALVITKPDMQIYIYDISNPEKVEQVKKIPLKKENNVSAESVGFVGIKGGNSAVMAVALTRLASGHFLLCSYDYNKIFNFYISITPNIKNGFRQVPFSVNKDAVKGKGEPKNYQNITFVTDDNGQLFLIGTTNSQEASPIIRIGARDHADLLAVYPKIENGRLASVRVDFIHDKHMYCDTCNFNAGATAYVADQNNLWMYGVSHWLKNTKKPGDGKGNFPGMIAITQFASY